MTTTEGAAFSKTAAKELLSSRSVDTGAAGWGRIGSEADAAAAVRQNSGISNLSFIENKTTSAWTDFKGEAANFWLKQKTDWRAQSALI